MIIKIKQDSGVFYDEWEIIDSKEWDNLSERSRAIVSYTNNGKIDWKYAKKVSSDNPISSY